MAKVLRIYLKKKLVCSIFTFSNLWIFSLWRKKSLETGNLGFNLGSPRLDMAIVSKGFENVGRSSNPSSTISYTKIYLIIITHLDIENITEFISKNKRTKIWYSLFSRT